MSTDPSPDGAGAPPRGRRRSSAAGPAARSATPSSPAGSPAQEPAQEPASGSAGSPAPAGPELARAVLDAAKARRGAPRGGRGPGGARESTQRQRQLRGYSGPGPDPRDPQPFGAVLARLIKVRGWERPAAEATLFGQWERVVGADVAAHCRPVKLENGELTVEAVSTAWATQLRMLAAALLRQIAGEVGHNVVTKLRIHGPTSPSWNRGPRRVRGRGPRDTYG